MFNLYLLKLRPAFLLFCLFLGTFTLSGSTNPELAATASTLVSDFDDCQESTLSELGMAIKEAKTGHGTGNLSAAKEATSRMIAAMMAEVTECCATGASADDAEQMTDGTQFGSTDNILGLGEGAISGGGYGPQVVGLRFDCYNIPQGAVITSAYVQFTAANSSTRSSALTIRGEDADDCLPFTATNPIVGRVATSASAAWSPPTWIMAGDALAAQQTPDITNIIQEIVNRPGYASGNAICLSITGKGNRQAFSFDSGGASPELCVTYDIPDEITTCEDCPNVTLASLDGVPNFPEVDLLNVCSEPDTISLLIYNNGECDLSNVQVTIDFDSGLTYGGCVENHNGGPVTADEFDVSNPSMPVFLITQIDSAEAFIINICVKADCNVNIKSAAPLNFDVNLQYSYPDDDGTDHTCNTDITEIGEFNGGVRIPVLNALAISPQEITIPNTTSESCQTITVGQDGIQSQLSQFTLDINGIDFVNYCLGTLSVNGIAIPASDITLDMTLGTATTNISGAYFIPNTGFGSNGDEIFDENERLTITACWKAIGCTDQAMVLDYGMYYGCNDEICFGTTNTQGAVSFTPNFGATAIANVSNVTYGQICGAPLSYTIDLFSNNTDPVDGLWQDLILKYGACLGSGMTVSDIEINGVTLDASLYSVSNSTLTLDFTANTDAAYGLSDEDGDGFLDDLPGGENLLITTNIEIGCAESMGACTGNLACSLTRIEVNGKRNCGQDFQQFANLSSPISFFYGNSGTSTNAVATQGYGLPITEVMNTTCDVWLPAMNGYEFHYDFDSNNIGGCADSGGIKMIAYVTANGDRITDVQYEAGSATYQGNPVPGTTFYYDEVDIGGGLTDTIGMVIEIPVGDNMATAHDYYFNLEFRGDCYPNDYMFVNFKVVEECNSCTEVDPCEIVRACDSAATYVDWNGCGCVCDIRAFVDTLQRTNYGFADKAMTQPLTAAQIPSEDLKRFLPGDTMFFRVGIEVLNSTVYYEGNYRWLFDVRYYTWEAPLMPDVYNANFLGWFHEDVSAGTGPIEIGIPDCMQAYDDANRDNQNYPSMRIENFGVEGTLADGGECSDDDENPNYPGSSVAAYRMVDFSAYDAVNDLSRLDIFFGRDPGCTSVTPDELNTCHADLLAQLDLEDGDFFYFDVSVPLVRNPNVSLAALNGVTPSVAQYIYPYAMTYQNSPGTCSTGANARTCRTTGQYEGHLPGPMTIVQDVCVTDCDTEVEYTFNLTNPIPTVDAGITPWYEAEYRPFMATDYLEVSFPSNMVYLDNGVIVMPDGTEKSFSPYIDTNVGNLNCLTGPGGEQCCIAADPSQLAMMKIVDNDYTIGQSHTYYRGPIGANNTNDICDVNQLIHVPNDPYPHIPVGGTGGPCSYGLKYSLSALCPEDIESSDFQLTYQFSDPYVPSLPGSGGVYNSYHHYSDGNPYPSSNGFRYPINPYGTGCETYPNTTYTWDYGCQQFYENIVSNPDDSPGSINPMRQTGTVVSTPDNFSDKSMNFPPLIANIQNVLIADEAMAPEINTYMVCSSDNGVDMGTHENVVTTIEIPTTIDLVDICDDMGTPIAWILVNAGPTSNLYSVVNPDLAVDECFEIQIKTELLFCPIGLDVETGISVTTVSGCLDPAKAALFTALGETQCDAAGATYEYIAEEAEMQAEWSRDAIGEYPLCQTFEMGVRIKNVKPSILTDIEPDWWFPQGISFVPGTWKVCYPGGPGNNGAVMSIPDPIADPSLNNLYGSNFGYADDSIWSDFIDQNGLLGVASTLDSNRVEFKFDVETVCDEFVSGTSIWFNADGADPCESRTGTGFVPTNPIIIDGANPSDFAQFFVFANPLDATCGEESEITLNFLNTSPTGTTDNSMVCMDINTTTFAYMMGSIEWVTPASHMPTFEESVNGAVTHVCFDIPDGIGPGQAFQVKWDFTVPEDIACGEQDLGVAVSSTVMNTSCMDQGITCNVDVLNSVNPAIQVDFNPPIEVADQTITVGCGNGDGTVPICYSVDFANNGADYAQDVKIKIIRDLNYNGLLDNFDPAIDSVVQMITVLAGDTVTVNGCIDVLESISCPIFLMVMQETNCVCDSQDFYYDSIEPEASDELGQVISVCPGEPLKIGYCGDWDYSISPAAGATIAPNAAGDSLCISITPGYGETSPVTLMVNSQTGGCMEFGFETDIYSLGGFDFGPFAEVNACSTGCQMLDLNLPTEFIEEVTVLWSPTTYLDDPTSQTPIMCDPQMDMTYNVTVFFMQNGQMCEFTADYPVVVEMQQTNNLFSQGSLCTTATASFDGPAGYSNYNWYEVTPAGDIPVQAGSNPTFIAPSTGIYYLEYYNSTDICKTLSAAFDVIACPSMVKDFVSAEPTANENEYEVCYRIDVENNSTLATEYDLYDLPTFDSDITILSGSYTSTAGPSGTLTVPGPLAPGWLIGSDVILPGLAMHTFEICLIVAIDLEDGVTGDDMYSACGSGGGGVPMAGEGLFNLASLDMNDDGVMDIEDEACGELPYYTIEKTIVGVTQTGAYDFTVAYNITVCNDGGGFGEYDLTDVPGFDSDIIVNGASFTTDAFGHPSNPGPTSLLGSGPWMLSDNQDIEPMECQVYGIVVMVTMDLEDAGTPGDGSYTACGANGGGSSQPGEGLHNTAELDTNDDGMPNDEAEACGDLPSITHEKVLTSITQTGARSYDVKYTVTVSNNGGAAGMYDLLDTPLFEDDIVITAAEYTSTATGNPANPGPTALVGTGPWMLGDDMIVAAMGADVYCLIVSVEMDLLSGSSPGDATYSACGSSVLNDPEAGEGLYNESSLDLDNDGTAEEVDEACGDLPNLYHEKEVLSFVPMANGNHVVTYEICVYNIGGADGDYDLYDEPIFDDDVQIVSASFSCDTDPGSGLSTMPPAGGWLLIDNQTIAPGTSQCCEVEIVVNADLSATSSGDNVIDECGSASGTDDSAAGEALHNESSLDIDNDGVVDELDEACQDLPLITHEKTIASVTQQANGSWCAVFNIVVTNEGTVSGYYDLYDAPNFEDDFVMLSAQYSSTVHINTGLAVPAPVGGWQIANDVLLTGGGIHVYTLNICIDMDLMDAGTPGDGVYTSCGDGSGGLDPAMGEGFFNESLLDTNDDGIADQIDTVCADIPVLTLAKTINDVLQTGPRSWIVSYDIEVCNDGGAAGTYDLSDTPGFDSDIEINGATYTSDATGNLANPGPMTLVGTGPWVLGNDQTIAEGTCQNYTLMVDVTMDLTDAATPGDGMYTECGAATPGVPTAGEGLYNQASLDTNNDGMTDLVDDACADLPSITHEKELTSITQTGARTYDVKYTVTVSNIGGADGMYDLLDTPSFDSDIAILGATYTSTATGNPANPGPLTLTGTGPWTLGDDMTVVAMGSDVYCLIVSVEMDLLSATTPGDGTYTGCGALNGAGNPEPGEGLYNESALDLDNDGMDDEVDEACGDLPNLTHEKTVVSFVPMASGDHVVTYEICVMNIGGADGDYDLYDEPIFDDDVTIVSASYSCDTDPGSGLSTMPPAGGWLLLDNETIAGGATQCCEVEIVVNADLSATSSGDNVIDECGSASGTDDSAAGEALHNESSLDINNDGIADEMDEACQDLPVITHVKTIANVTQQANGSWCALYNIVVTNEGSVDGYYDLYDAPNFEDDFVMVSAQYSSTVHINTGLVTPAPAGGWQIGDDELLAAGNVHTYALTVCVDVDLMDPSTPGDGIYTACGGPSGASDPTGGEGFFNESLLDTNNDGVADQLDTVCADIPVLSLMKSIDNVLQTGPRNWSVKYRIEVCNDGGADGTYDLSDIPGFDDDVEITAAAFNSDAPGNEGPFTLVGSGPWSLADDQIIIPGTCQTYSIDLEVSMDLTDPSTPGDESYTECGSSTPGDLTPGEGLYNQAALDTNNDGVADEVDEVCADLPAITHDKELTSITQVGARDFEVKYTITVQNDGGAPGMYDLNDEIFYEDDIVVTCARYTSTAPTNPANPGPVSLPLSGLWNLGDDMTVTPANAHVYCLTVCVTMDLMDASTLGDGNYDACGSGGLNGEGSPGQGLYNESYLDLNNDDIDDEVDSACGDLPYVWLEKTFLSFVPMANGNHASSYEICVYNTGGADGEYNLWDEPGFDDDLTILSASYSCDTDPGMALTTPIPAGGWLLLSDQTIAPGVTQCCVIEIEVDMDFSDASGGDNLVSQCGAANNGGDPMPGEALYNESTIDVNDDGVVDEMDEACEDIPMIEHVKSIASVTQNLDDSYCIVFNITVTNESVQAGFYDLYDLPQFDGDIVILSADYSSSVHIPTSLPTTPPATGWQLANDISIAPNGIHIYTLTTCVIIDLQDPMPLGGDGDYTSCGETSGTPDLTAGEGLFNESLLDTNDDGIADQLDTVCADLPYVTHTKAFVDAYRNADGTYTANFKVTVENIGGATGLYDLWDQPSFEDDFEILSASYTSDAVGSSANPGPTALMGAGPWTLADDQSIDAQVVQCYNLSVIVDINLSDPDTVGDELYTWCGTANGAGDPEPGEGFYNESFLDRSNDGDPEEVEETCGDIEIVDLAIQKEIVTQGPYMYGQVVEFVHTIYNQGNIDMYNVQLSDYLPAGYGFAGVAGNDASWTQTNPTLLDYSFIAGPILPATSTTVTLYLEILPTTGGNEDWWNYSEITSMEDEDGMDRSDDDVDSDPDNDPDNDNDVDPGDDNDNEITGGGPDEGEDEDDHDVEGIEIFDLAQIKTTTAMAPLSYGDVIPFTITVFNQGSETATNIPVIDHLPCGFEYLASNDANGWSYDMTSSQATIVIDGPLEPGTSTTVMIDVTLQQCIDMDEGSFTNISEIAGGDGEDGDPGDDIDSDPDGDPDNDGDPIDDEEDDPNDEDDHDPETLAIFDLAQIKELVTPGPYSYGQLLEFSITVCNQGNQPVQNIEVTDYVPAGYTFAQADQTVNWMSVGTDQVYTIPGPLAADACVSVPLFLTVIQTTGGQEDWINYSEITAFEDTNGDMQEDADSDPGSDGMGENDVDPGDPADDDLESTDQGGEEDDHDPSGFEVFDLSLVKTTTATAPFYYGDAITFTIEVFNQGSITATNMDVLDHIPCGYMYLASNDATGWSYDMTSSQALINIAGPLEPGASTTVDIILELQQCIPMSEDAFLNIAEIESAEDDEGNEQEDIDSDPDGDPDNDGDPIDNENDDPNDEDDHDPENIEIYDLAQIKEIVTAGPYSYGQLLEFSITVCNQGNQTVQNIELVDYLPVGYSFAAANQTASWTPTGVDNNIAHTIGGPLLAEECISVPLFLTLEMTTGGLGNYTNVSEISGFEDENGDEQEDADSDPDSDPNNDGDPNDDSMDDPNDEDDHDPETVEIFDLAQVKTTAQTPPFYYGDEITFTIEVFNQGNVPAINIDVIDHLPCGYEYLAVNNGTGWSYDMAASQAVTTIAGPLMPGTSTTVDIVLEIKQCLPNSFDAFLNISEIESAEDEDGNEGEDIDSDSDDDPNNDGDPVDDETDDPNDEDDHDPEDIQIWDLSQIKEIVTQGPYSYGQVLEFAITVCNQGNQSAQNIALVDYLPAGYSFDASIQTIAWAPSGTNSDVAYTIPGPLLAEDCVVLPLFLTLEMTSGGVGNYTNISEITMFEDTEGNIGIDADSDPDTDPGNDGDPNDNQMDDPNDEDDHDPEVVNIFDLALVKSTVTPGPFAFGDLVEYQFTIYNQGSVAASSASIIDYLPCGLLFDAAINTGWILDAASNTATYEYNMTIEAGASANVSIFLTVDPCDEPGAWYNEGEITDATDENGDPIDDTDSDPDSDPDNDGDPIDDEFNDPNDEDDNDPEEIPIFDLALRKTIEDRGPYAPGEIADFEIEVFNQGNVTAFNVELTDYLNIGFEFNEVINPGWTQSGSLITYNYAGPLAPGESDVIHIYLEIAVPAGADLQSWINEAEISGGENEDGDAQTDADSNLDNDPDNDNDVNPGDDDDNVIDEHGGDGEDEDDNDVADVIVTGEIGDEVWKDVDGDGIQDDDELGVEGVIVNLYDCNGNYISSDTTDATGYYLFDLLLPGGYQLEFDLSDIPLGCDWTMQNQGGDESADSDVDANGMTDCIDLEGGEMNHDIDGGLLPLAKIGDLVWQDCDGDGQQGVDEVGLPSIQVNLYAADGTLVSTTYTDMNGAYLFDLIYPGDYYLEFITPGEYLFTEANLGNSSGNDSDVNNTNGAGTTSVFTLSPGECDLNSGDAGMYKCVQIGDLVWFDTNENNVWDSGENGVNGLRVNLFKANGAGVYELYEYTYTGHKPDTPSDDGYFKFCAPPGNYYVEFAQPPYGMVPALANQGNFEEIDSDITGANGVGTTDSFSVSCGNENCDLGAGYYPMGTIGDFVWFDENQNGMRDPGETGLENVMVEAYDVNGVMLGFDNTDEDGVYHIEYLQAADVYLKFSAPSGFAPTLPNMTSDDMDSDIDNSNGAMTTKYYDIVPGQHIPNVDAGLIFGVVPVQWMSFTGERKGAHNQLDWKVTSQIDVSHYEVERSVNGTSDFTTIGKILSEGESADIVNYDYQDYDIGQSGVYYYRIMQVDFDGETSYTEIIAIDVERLSAELPRANVYPNPMVDDYTLEVETYEDGLTIEYEIMDVDGKLVEKRTRLAERVIAGKHIFMLSARDLAPGIYTMRVNAGPVIVNKKLIVVSN